MSHVILIRALEHDILSLRLFFEIKTDAFYLNQIKMALCPSRDDEDKWNKDRTMKEDIIIISELSSSIFALKK